MRSTISSDPLRPSHKTIIANPAADNRPRQSRGFLSDLLLLTGMFILSIASSGCEYSWHWCSKPVAFTDTFIGGSCKYETDAPPSEQGDIIGILDKQKCYEDADDRDRDYECPIDCQTVADPVLNGSRVIFQGSDGHVYDVSCTDANSIRDLDKTHDDFGDFRLPINDTYRFSATPALSADGAHLFLGGRQKSGSSGVVVKLKLSNDSLVSDKGFTSAGGVRADIKVDGQWVWVAAGPYIYKIEGNTFTKSALDPYQIYLAEVGGIVDNAIVPWPKPPVDKPFRIGPFKPSIPRIVNSLVEKSISLVAYIPIMVPGIPYPGDLRSLLLEARKVFLVFSNVDAAATDNIITSSPVITDKFIYFTTRSNIFCIDKGGLYVRWIQPLAGNIPENYHWTSEFSRFQTTMTLDTDDGRLYSSEGQKVVCRNLSTGDPIWECGVTGALHAAPTLWKDNTCLVVGTRRGIGYGISLASGDITRQKDFGDGPIYAPAYIDTTEKISVFFTYGNERGGVKLLDVEPGILVNLPISLDIEGTISYETTPSGYVGTITTVTRYTQESGDNNVTFEKRVKENTPVTYRITVNPNPAGGGMLNIPSAGEFSDSTPADYSDAVAALRFTRAYPVGSYSVTLRVGYTNPDDTPGNWTISTTYTITAPQVPGVNVAFQGGSPPLDMEVYELFGANAQMQGGNAFVDEDRPAQARAICRYVRQDIPWANMEADEYISPWTPNPGAGLNTAVSVCGIIPPTHGGKIKIVWNFSRGTPLDITQELEWPAEGTIYESGASSFRNPTIPSKALWGNPAYAINNVFTEIQYWVIIYSSVIVDQREVQIGETCLREEEEVDEETGRTRNVCVEWEPVMQTQYRFQLQEVGRVWTAKDPSAYVLKAGIRDKTPPVILPYPHISTGFTGDLLDMRNIFYWDNNELDVGPWRFDLFVENSDYQVPGIAHDGWTRISGICPAVPPGGTARDTKELQAILNPSNPNDLTPVKALLPMKFAGEKVLRFYLRLWDSSDNWNPGSTNIEDNHDYSMGYNLGGLPEDWNPMTVTADEKIGYISVIDNDKPDIYVTVEPESRAILMLQPYRKIEYIFRTDEFGNAAYTINWTDPDTSSPMSESHTLTDNYGHDPITTPIEHITYSPGIGLNRFSSSTVVENTDGLSDTLYYAFPQDKYIRFYVKYDDNVKYMDHLSVASNCTEALLWFKLYDNDDDRFTDATKNPECESFMEFGPYGYAGSSSTRDIQKYDDDDPGTTDDVFATFAFRYHSVDPETQVRGRTRPPLMDARDVNFRAEARDPSGNGRTLKVKLPVLKTRIETQVLEQNFEDRRIDN